MTLLKSFWTASNRRKPYTAHGIKRVPCVRCGNPAVHQWQICADGNIYRGLCLACDIELNALVLAWANDPQAGEKIRQYQTLQIASTSRAEGE